jgi:hypothetical protein
MKFILFLALFFTAVFNAAAQTPKPSPSPSPEEGTSISTTPDRNLPVRRADPNLLLNTYKRPDSKTRFKRYVKSVVGPTALAKNVVFAGYATWRNSPEEWGDKWEGFGRRFASGVGKSAIKGTTMYAMDEAFKLDSAFYRSKKTTVGGRLGDALVSAFTARKPDGRKVLGVPRIAGTYASSIIAAETWYPKRFDYKDGLKSGTISLGLNAVFNVFKEFVRK